MIHVLYLRLYLFSENISTEIRFRLQIRKEMIKLLKIFTQRLLPHNDKYSTRLFYCHNPNKGRLYLQNDPYNCEGLITIDSVYSSKQKDVKTSQFYPIASAQIQKSGLSTKKFIPNIPEKLTARTFTRRHPRVYRIKCPIKTREDSWI